VLFIGGCYKGHECIDWATKENLGKIVKVQYIGSDYVSTAIQTEKVMIILEGRLSVWEGANAIFVKDCNDRPWFAWMSDGGKNWSIDLVNKLEAYSIKRIE
jgi:hypothetical protein